MKTFACALLAGAASANWGMHHGAPQMPSFGGNSGGYGNNSGFPQMPAAPWMRQQ